MNKKISHAKLHSALFVQGLGTVGETLPPSGRTYHNIELYRTEDGIEGQMSSLPTSPIIKFWVPSANIVGLTYSETATAPAKAPQKAAPAASVTPSAPPAEVKGQDAEFSKAVAAVKSQS